MKKPVIIVIPVYREQIFSDEKKSLIQCGKILGKYDFCFVCPKNLNTKNYEDILKNIQGFEGKIEVKRFDPEHFKSVKKYSCFCLESTLYRAFLGYEYMFLYQLDGWVFKDELKYWCNKGFDYIGAPQFEKYDKADETSNIIEFSGNGGVSLRKISSFIKALEDEENRVKSRPVKAFVNFLFNKKCRTEFQKLKDCINEDLIITEYFRNNAGFNVAPVCKSMYFSFEVLPERLYSLTGGVLPFACHGYDKYGGQFWKRFIDADDTAFSCVQFAKPVLLLVFNRPDTLKEVFQEIKNLRPKRLYIASDGPREEIPGEKEKVFEVRDYLLNNIDWECEVKTKFNEKNLGCEGAVSKAITWFFENEEDGIILEDDCVPTRSFFDFCACMLDYYRDYPEVWHIGGYNYLDLPKLKESYYFSTIPHVWGWATWANRWKNFDFNLANYSENLLNRLSLNKNFLAYWIMIFRGVKAGTINSWAYRWAFSLIKGKGLAVVPKYNMVKNIGNFGLHYSWEDDCLNTKTYNSADFPGEDGKNIIYQEKIKVQKKIMDKMFAKWLKIPNRFIKNVIHIDERRAVVLFRRFIYKLK